MARACDRLHAHFIHTPASVTLYQLLPGLALDLLGACQGHLDLARLGAAEKLDRRVDGDLHPHRVERLQALRTGMPAFTQLSWSGPRPVRPLRRLPARREPAATCRPAEHPQPSAAPYRRRASTCCCARWRCCPPSFWRLEHIGRRRDSGCSRRGRELGIADRIDWPARSTSRQVLEHYRRADHLRLACRIAADGDRDGLPNVLVEASARACVCVSTSVAGECRNCSGTA